MNTVQHFDDIDRHILRIISTYGQLHLEDLWYELGEIDPPIERFSHAEVERRLESMAETGYVACVSGEGEHTVWAVTSKRMP
jgi:DNA-binding Lrp family transcriptional regulator